MPSAITSLPLSIATPDSGLFQTDKAGFQNLILKQSDAVRKDYPKNAKWIIDGMTAIRSAKPRNTYEEWFLALTDYMKPPAATHAQFLDIVMDVYVDKSVKECTRRHRGGKPGPRTLITSSQQKMLLGEKWVNFLNNGENKNNLISQFVNFLKSPS